MTTIKPHQAYQQNSVMTASPQELTLMLYNGCIKFIKLARKGMIEKDFEEKNVNLIKAQAIVQELRVTLDQDIEISTNMAHLYEYMYNRLVEANMKNEFEILSEVEGYIVDMRDAWKQAMKAAKQRA